MSDEYNKTARYIVRIGVPAVVIIFIVGFVASAYNRRIDADRATVIEVQRTEQKAIAERQKTERTEERAQFWQKIVPWGNDESETNK